MPRRSVPANSDALESLAFGLVFSTHTPTRMESGTHNAVALYTYTIDI
jgi:hypothetical protein